MLESQMSTPSPAGTPAVVGSCGPGWPVWGKADPRLPHPEPPRDVGEPKPPSVDQQRDRQREQVDEDDELEDEIDEAGEESFPASDSPAIFIHRRRRAG